MRFDLHDAADRATVRAIALQCDLLLENFRPGRLDAWDLGYESLRAENPRIVYASISGYGQTGPYRARTGLRQHRRVDERPALRHRISRPPAGADRHLARRRAGRGLHSSWRSRRCCSRASVTAWATGSTCRCSSRASRSRRAAPRVRRARHRARALGKLPQRRRAVQRLPDARRAVDRDRRERDSLFRRFVAAMGRPELARRAALSRQPRAHGARRARSTRWSPSGRASATRTTSRACSPTRASRPDPCTSSPTSCPTSRCGARRRAPARGRRRKSRRDDGAGAPLSRAPDGLAPCGAGRRRRHRRRPARARDRNRRHRRGDRARQNVTKTFETGYTALRDVDLDVEPERFVALVGPSGCGKLIDALADRRTGPADDRHRARARQARRRHHRTDRLSVPARRAAAVEDRARDVHAAADLRGVRDPQARERTTEWIGRVGLRGFERRTRTSSRAACASASRSRRRWCTIPRSC